MLTSIEDLAIALLGLGMKEIKRDIIINLSSHRKKEN
jgi:hypothetical protein